MRTNYNIKLPLSDRRDKENRLLLEKIDVLRKENADLKAQNEKLEEEYSDYYSMKARCEVCEYTIQKLQYELDRTRKRDGRPERFSFNERQLIRQCRINGMSITKLAEEFRCSTSTIHAITKDIKIDLRRHSKNVQL